MGPCVGAEGLVNSDGDNMHLVAQVHGVSAQHVVRRAFDEASRVPTFGVSTASMFNEKLRLDLLFLGDLIALQTMDVFPQRSLVMRELSENSRGAWGALL